MVVSLDAFRQYQLENAWVWEHQALTRARFCRRRPGNRPQFEAIRIEVLRQRRDLASCAAKSWRCVSAWSMAHPNKTRTISISSTTAAALMDVEFIVQYLVLGHAFEHASPDRQPGQHRAARDGRRLWA